MSNPFIVKTAGGAGSQLLALMNASLVSAKIKRPFQIRHYPTSTGTYWPFAMGHLLDGNEIEELSTPMRGMVLPTLDTARSGSILTDHPLESKYLNLAKVMGVLTKSGLDVPLRRMRSEWEVKYSLQRLLDTPASIKYLTGGYFPLFNEIIENDLERRFQQFNALSFIPKPDSSPNSRIVIHYRLGDKRQSFNHKKLEIDGVVDPQVFRKILLSERGSLNEEVTVVSDEPDLANKLLKSVGINAKTDYLTKDIWTDLQLLTDAELLICSWSAVSQVAASISAQKNRTVYYPKQSSTGFVPRWEIPGVELYSPYFIDSEFDWSVIEKD
jgi:hypothetical protein